MDRGRMQVEARLKFGLSNLLSMFAEIFWNMYYADVTKLYSYVDICKKPQLPKDNRTCKIVIIRILFVQL